MARVTVEDCIDKVPNRFELVLMAANRARAISNGMPITIERDNDKNPVVALREIAEQTIKPNDLLEDLYESLQKYTEVDEPETNTPGSSLEPRQFIGQDDMAHDNQVDRITMSEDELIRGLESLAPPENPGAPSRNR